MSDETKKNTPRIRTFANDLDQIRQGKTTTSKPISNKPKPEETEPVISEVKDKVIKHVPKPIKENIVVKETPKKISEKKERQKENNKKIPSFHELQKQVKNIQATPEPTKKRKREEKKLSERRVPRPNIGYDATIITDTKSNRYNLFSSIGDSLRDWFRKLTAPRKRKTPKYVVPTAVHRKGVIQKATTKTGSIFAADNDTLKEHIRLRQQAEYIGAKNDEDPETTWSPYTEPIFELLDAPDVTQNIKVEYKKRSVPPPIIEDEQQPDDGAQELLEARKKLDENSATTPAGPSTYTPSVQQPAQTAVQEVEVVEEVNPSELPTSPKPVTQTDSNSLIEKTDTNTLTIVTLITVIGLIILLLVSRLFIQQMNNNSVVDSSNNEPIENLAGNIDLKKIIIDTTDRTNLSSLINRESSDTEKPLAEIVFMRKNGAELDPIYIFESLELRAAPALKQSLNHVRVLINQNSEEVILLKFVDETIVRGELLNWENIMAADFSKLYELSDEPVVVFTDENILGFDVRVGTKEEEVMILYSIIDDDTSLIANNKSDLTKALELIVNE